MLGKPAPTPRKEGKQIVTLDGAIPRMGMNVPMPAGTKPPAQSGQQSSTSSQQARK